MVKFNVKYSMSDDILQTSWFFTRKMQRTRENWWCIGRRECFGWMEFVEEGYFEGLVDSVGVAERCEGGVRKHVVDGEGRVELAMFA